MHRLKLAFVIALFLSFLCNVAHPQSSVQPSPNSQLPTLTARSNLVLVPVLVKSKDRKIVFSLAAEDFNLTDNGIPQAVRVEEDALGQPLALAVIVQTGGQGTLHLRDYRNLGAILDAVIGGVSHRVAVIGFDSTARLVQDFTPDTDTAAETIANLHGGDAGVAILDALSFGIELLRTQPPAYRRAVLLFSETVDNGSQTSFDDAVRAVEDTNTAIYSFGFSSTQTAVKHEASKLPAPGGTPYSNEPYAPGGCMSRDPKADPDAHGKRGVQALDCASDLLPPLRLARMAFLLAKDGLRRNVPRCVAQLTGGEYFAFKDAKTLAQHLINISNDVPNYYYLSFHPQSPLPGPHALELKVKNRADYEVRARKGYWVDAETGTKE
ncbi:MAG: VWA domain-containing protein [Candidatus Angelobacter sp.]